MWLTFQNEIYEDFIPIYTGHRVHFWWSQQQLEDDVDIVDRSRAASVLCVKSF